jgi:hypothetical protein
LDWRRQLQLAQLPARPIDIDGQTSPPAWDHPPRGQAIEHVRQVRQLLVGARGRRHDRRISCRIGFAAARLTAGLKLAK